MVKKKENGLNSFVQMRKNKIIRITTVPQSLAGLLKGQLKYLSDNDFEVWGISSPGNRLQEVEKQQQVSVHAIPMTRTISPFKDFKAFWQLLRFLKKEKPDIVHTHTPKAGTLGMIAAYMAGIPVRLHTVAGLPLLVTSGPKRQILNSVEKITYRCATKIYPNSFGLKEIILKNKYTKNNKLKVIANGSSNGIDVSVFDPDLVSERKQLQLRRELNIPKEATVFLFVGRIVADKGINELVLAFDNVSQQYKKAHLVLVGNFENDLDPLKLKTNQIIENHPQIHAVGYKKNVVDYFALADVLTFPSYREGFPNVVMQAAAMQLNAIVSNINGCNEIITDGDNGWIVPVKNVQYLEERMIWCLSHPKDSKRMGKKSRRLMKENYDRRFVWKEILKEYHSLLDKSG